MPQPEKLKKKCIAVYRSKLGIKISHDNMLDGLLFTELNRNALQYLAGLCHSVYSPFIEGRKSNTGSGELSEKFNAFLSNLCVTWGLADGKTMLPLPPISPHLPEIGHRPVLTTQVRDQIRIFLSALKPSFFVHLPACEAHQCCLLS